jgi:tetratricopeptide (TPR) repeat protein
MTALFVFSCFSYPFEFVTFQVLGVFCLAGVRGGGTRVTRIFADFSFIFALLLIKIKSAKIRIIRVICVPLLLSACGLILITSYNYFTTIKEWNRAFYTHSSSERADKFQILYPDLKQNATFVAIYGKTLYDTGRYNEAIPVLEKAITLFPSAHTFILLGDAYEKTGAYREALKTWETAKILPAGGPMPTGYSEAV